MIVTMKLWSFAITVCRHFSSKAAFGSNQKTGKINYWIKAANRSKKVRTPKLNWTDEQNRVLEAVSKGKSVFVTGSAGTGKTFLLEEIIKKLKKIHGWSRVYVTASTGVASCALHGQTLHSFAGVGFGELDREGLLERVLSDKGACRRWRKVKALVIDETSMVDAKLFDGLAYVARTLREDKETWGGIQLIVSGDFFQLSPIIGRATREKKKTKEKKRKKKGDVKVYAFEADCWDSSFDLQIELTRVFRQSDSLLVHLLQGIRRAEIGPDELELLVECCSVTEPDPDTVRLFPRISDVDEVNKEKMKGLGEEIYTYTAQDSGEKQWKRQLQIGIARDTLEVCIGARVMLIKNISPWRKLVNGATGTVLGFSKLVDKSYGMSADCSHGDVLPLVKFDSGSELIVEPETWEVRDGDKVVAKRRQIPLILSWALSIHKCQGMSLDKLHTDLSRVFGHGMVYVALSRVRSLAGLGLSGLEPSKITAHPKVLKFYRGFRESGEGGSDVVVGKKKPS
ncbi:ATP-dependent DNA helicase PIF1-like [Salvia splendens]|uniref:ATP-dependent DNA helicase PIF1-like n=1 Tax=Salvia splendens TaxID=180675 RepID=UPI001C2778D4|nr:ATP-dependent DNA helicase PIF1-like [Salvia splendens]